MTKRKASTPRRVRLQVLLEEYRKKRDGWMYVLSPKQIPDECGHYALHDGLDCRGAGVTYHMRHSVLHANWFGRMALPIYAYLPDTDGSGALWLEGQINCKRCGDIHEIGKHDEEDGLGDSR